jgi:hypothetical protein
MQDNGKLPVLAVCIVIEGLEYEPPGILIKQGEKPMSLFHIGCKRPSF